MNIWKCILNFLLPPRCIYCGQILEDADGICAECFNQMTFISAPYYSRCGLPFTKTTGLKSKMLCPNCLKEKKPLFRYIRNAVKYDDFSKTSILAFKFMDKTENACVFAKWLKFAGKDIFDEGVDLIIPVPLHYLRLFKRKYNQSALLSKELSKLTGVETDFFSLKKIRHTKPQVSFSGKARVKNVKNAFTVKNNQNIIGKRIVLIDDVMTTGSTLTECAKSLLAAGAKSVDALTIARVYR